MSAAQSLRAEESARRAETKRAADVESLTEDLATVRAKVAVLTRTLTNERAEHQQTLARLADAQRDAQAARDETDAVQRAARADARQAGRDIAQHMEAARRALVERDAALRRLDRVRQAAGPAGPETP